MPDLHCPKCAGRVEVPAVVAQVRCTPNELVVMFSDMHVAHQCPDPSRDRATASEIASLRETVRRQSEAARYSAYLLPRAGDQLK